MGSESVNEAVEDEDQVMDFVTLGMFIIGMLSSVSCLLCPVAFFRHAFSPYRASIFCFCTEGKAAVF